MQKVKAHCFWFSLSTSRTESAVATKLGATTGSRKDSRGVTDDPSGPMDELGVEREV